MSRLIYRLKVSVPDGDRAKLTVRSYSHHEVVRINDSGYMQFPVNESQQTKLKLQVIDETNHSQESIDRLTFIPSREPQEFTGVWSSLELYADNDTVFVTDPVQPETKEDGIVQPKD
jgi:hypothetical protein